MGNHREPPPLLVTYTIDTLKMAIRNKMKMLVKCCPRYEQGNNHIYHIIIFTWYTCPVMGLHQISHAATYQRRELRDMILIRLLCNLVKGIFQKQQQLFVSFWLRFLCLFSFKFRKVYLVPNRNSNVDNSWQIYYLTVKRKGVVHLSNLF